MDLVQSLPSATRMVDLLSSFATAFEQRTRLLKVACDTESELAADILLPHRLTGSRSGFPLKRLIPGGSMLGGSICHLIAGKAAMNGESTSPFGGLGTLLMAAGAISFLVLRSTIKPSATPSEKARPLVAEAAERSLECPYGATPIPSRTMPCPECQRTPGFTDETTANQLLTTEDLLHKAHRLHSRGILQSELDMHLFLVNRNPESREAWRAIRHSSSANQALREKAVTELGRIEKSHTDLQTV